MKIKQIISRFRHRQIAGMLCNTNSEKLAAVAGKKTVAAFKKAVKRIPAYRKILKDNGVHKNDIKCLEDFTSKVPVITKKDFFVPFGVEEWFGKRVFSKLKNVMTSSGYSGTFAFGAETNPTGNLKKGVDFTLDYLFNTSEKKSFLINCIPMGVHVTTSLALAETSVRSDMAIALAKKISPKFDQTIIVGDPHFLKKLIEEGIESGVDWKKINVSLICGQDWFPESFRTYLAHLTEMDIYNDKSRLIMATMGMTELGLNIFHESFDTIRIRKLSQQHQVIRKEIFKTSASAAPFLFHYYPHRNFIEVSEDVTGEAILLFSVLDNDAAIPLFRYDSGDSGNLISYNSLACILKQHHSENLIPALKLPLAGISGRRNNFILYRDNRIYPSDIKLGLYEDFEIAGKTTGYFRINQQEIKPVIEIQLKPGFSPDAGLISKFSYSLLKYLDTDLEVKCYTYHEFPYGMKLSYEHKFMNI